MPRCVCLSVSVCGRVGVVVWRRAIWRRIKASLKCPVLAFTISYHPSCYTMKQTDVVPGLRLQGRPAQEPGEGGTQVSACACISVGVCVWMAAGVRTDGCAWSKPTMLCYTSNHHVYAYNTRPSHSLAAPAVTGW